ncbi:MAG: prefoldin subunit beta [Methanobacteriota archaeon]|nr:MAG: prefoldin subunit beta [Euryarchaeota archaeon]
MKELPPQVQNQLAQFQQLQQQLQVLATQRLQLEAKLRELTSTLQELEKVTADTPVYRSTGALLVRVEDRPSLQKELEEQKETLEIRVNTIKKQEKSLGERYEQLQAKLSEALEGTGPTAS